MMANSEPSLKRTRFDREKRDSCRRSDKFTHPTKWDSFCHKFKEPPRRRTHKLQSLPILSLTRAKECHEDENFYTEPFVTWWSRRRRRVTDWVLNWSVLSSWSIDNANIYTSIFVESTAAPAYSCPSLIWTLNFIVLVLKRIKMSKIEEIALFSPTWNVREWLEAGKNSNP